MHSRTLKFAEQAAPRYTSYPSAPHFSENVDCAVLKNWLADHSPDGSISLYLHVPYCKQICWYCGCNTYAAKRNDPVADYVTTLLKEIELVGATLRAKTIREIHWGGGTPNILTARQFRDIVGRLRSVFDLSSVEHHAVEVDPRHLDAEQCAAFVTEGVTRASLGVQDLNPHVQEAMGRIQPLDLVKGAAAMLRDAGVEAVSMDLMYGLPRQSVADLCKSLQLTAAMAPQRIALFGYAHVPWFKKRQRLINEADLPGATERFEQAGAARETLVALGYQSIGLDHFALPDDELAIAARAGKSRRSFQGYVTDSPCEALIGLGPSSISTLPQGYAQSLSEVGAWASAVNAGKLPCKRGHALTVEDRARRKLIEQIMCDFQGNLGLIGGRAACAQEIAALQPLLEEGIAELIGDVVTVPQDARPFCRLVARIFDAYAASPAARHSRAV